ncbi:hypothetical protein [Sphingomonas koreensis]|jgi:hypothetical protein|uniref:hypothetical protein n=1 Tax=Sphingomonas koreensis TaxID=93064 RepID=UPI00234E63F0|nr:hypothetical protein [Sphingomonas koreensis]MDC7808600.1 hypothetical protein [Sphingomonas koreensis]|tara:strand:+ start:87388 stop:87648 length:261 start_codon:yes stop_codon:yes gene_type:complete
MPNQNHSVGNPDRVLGNSRNWSLIIGRALLVWALIEAGASGLVDISGRSFFGIGPEHFAFDGVIAALVGIGFILDGSARRLQSGKD